MKRWYLLWTLVLLALCCPVGACAAAGKTTYSVEQAGLTFEAAQDLIVTTRGMDADAPALEAIGMTAQEVDAQLYSTNCYWAAAAPDFSYELTVCVMSSPFDSVKNLSEKLVQELIDSLDSQQALLYETYEGAVYFQTRGESYFVIRASNSQDLFGTVTYFTTYYTIIGGRAILLSLSNYTLPKQEGEQIILDIVQSASFSNPTAPLEEYATQSPPTTYADDRLEFTIPENWIELPPSSELITVEFHRTENGIALIQYSCIDARMDLSALEAKYTTRAQMDHSWFLRIYWTQFWDGFDDVGSAWTEVMVGDVPYVRVELDLPKMGLSLMQSAHAYQYIHMEQGYMHLFQFAAAEYARWEPDFDAVLKSVVYYGAPAASAPFSPEQSARAEPTPAASQAAGAASAYGADSIETAEPTAQPVSTMAPGSEEGPTPARGAGKWLAAAAVVAAAGLFVCFRRKNTGMNRQTARFCTQCGARLKRHSVFCSQCGAPVAPVQQAQRGTEMENRVDEMNPDEPHFPNG